MDDQTQQNTQNQSQISDDQAQNMQQQLVQAFGIQDLPEEKQAEVLKRAGEIILKRLFLKVNDTLSEEDKTSFDQFLGKEPAPNQEETTEFLKGKIPNLDEVMLQEINDFKSEFQMA